mgnify:CR=1 FL=1
MWIALAALGGFVLGVGAVIGFLALCVRWKHEGERREK